MQPRRSRDAAEVYSRYGCLAPAGFAPSLHAEEAVDAAKLARAQLHVGHRRAPAPLRLWRIIGHLKRLLGVRDDDARLLESR